MTGHESIARAVRDAVLAVPGVVRLTPGAPMEVSTQFPGGKVVGVRLGDPVEVHVAVDRAPVVPVAERIRTAVREVLDRAGESRPVEVVVDDIEPVALTTITRRR